MISQMLEEARKYEIEAEKKIKEVEKPEFHLAARTGWMNDPNGFSYYGGKYHMFYQYYPYDTKWGPMHWAHAVSEDLLNWEHLPAALAPDEEYDKNGCFSGSALELPDGRHLLMYTGVSRKTDADETTSEFQQQCLAIGDGYEYKKLENNPVLDAKDLPEGSSRVDFRDPKIWRKSDGTYCCVVGSRLEDGSGQILLYTSENALDWKYEKVFASNNNRYGKMWECPDFFELDGMGVLLVSPQDMLPEGFEFHNGNGTLCVLGDYEEDTNTFSEKYYQTIDYGIDFYASQTTTAPDGRRIMMGWMQNWDSTIVPSREQKWFGQMAIPRELSVKNNQLYQWPVRELDEMRKNKISYQDVIIENDTVELDGVNGRKVDLLLNIRPLEDGEEYRKFSIFVAQGENNHTELSFRPYETFFKVDRKFSGSRRAVVHQRKCLVENYADELKLRIIMDRYSVEVFINAGEKVMSTTLYTDQKADKISFFADGKVKLNVEKYDL